MSHRATNYAVCDGTKKIFDTADQARQFARKMGRHFDSGRMNAYFCPDCHGYHNGHGSFKSKYGKRRMKTFYR